MEDVTEYECTLGHSATTGYSKTMFHSREVEIHNSSNSIYSMVNGPHSKWKREELVKEIRSRLPENCMTLWQKGEREKTTNDIKGSNIKDYETRDSKEVSMKKDSEADVQTTTESPLLVDESVNIQITPEGDLTPDLEIGKTLKDKIIEDKRARKNSSRFQCPLTRIWRQSSGTCEFLMKVTKIVFTFLAKLFFFGGLPLISIGMIVVGSLYVHECNIQPKIPVYLIGTGGTIFVQYISLCICVQYLIYSSLLVIAWFIYGCVIVYRPYSRVVFDDRGNVEYCNQTLYLSAFWGLNSCFIILVLIVLYSVLCSNVKTGPSKSKSNWSIKSAAFSVNSFD